ncbi:MAG: Coenzyme F420 hydrogenase/dehydrogenase, beta subunit C-terminal domain, partial [Muribaculaceae bacterium]|nr:Coenzyme F420 hydrogenase/dehydrogenase, beta subunit C-terminal domain [Muribaculaceae bacterium]
MIDIKRPQDCVGCEACSQKCPVQCISMESDNKGFWYPLVDLERCINCGLCERVCPVINQADNRRPIDVYAANNENATVRYNSSSGGVFGALASYIINRGGVVFGAKFDCEWDVVHAYSETLSGIIDFQGSKYVQSRIGTAFTDAESFLKQGRKVLFSGTPCQIAALRLFLRKDWGDQLVLVDIVCHGVPSPLVWQDYLRTLSRLKGANAGKNTVFSSLNMIPVITGIKFRDKRLGWEKYGFSVHSAATVGSSKNSVFPCVDNVESKEDGYELMFEPMHENMYMQGFLKDLYLRPSCYECPTKSGKSGSDITLGDYWGIQRYYPSLYDARGVSLVLTNTGRGEDLLNKVGIALNLTDFDMSIIHISQPTR